MKQLWRAILIFACAIVFGGIVTQTLATDSYQRGDVDGDGKITAADITMLARYVARIEPMPQAVSWLDSTEAKNALETYAKYNFIYNSYYGTTLLHRVSYTFYLGHLQYESATYSKEDYYGIGETIEYTGETYYYCGAEGCWMTYDIGEEYITAYDDSGEARFIKNGEELYQIMRGGEYADNVFYKE